MAREGNCSNFRLSLCFSRHQPHLPRSCQYPLQTSGPSSLNFFSAKSITHSKSLFPVMYCSVHDKQHLLLTLTSCIFVDILVQSSQLVGFSRLCMVDLHIVRLRQVLIRLRIYNHSFDMPFRLIPQF